MPRQPDHDLEDRILAAAQTLWKRGGEKALTMRAVSRAARTNTPALYRRFKDREHLVRGLLRRTSARIRQDFESSNSIEEMAEVYVESALRLPHDYELFYTHANALNPPRGSGPLRPIRDSRPNFALVENLLAERLGGSPQDHTQLALAIWSTLHGVVMLLLCKAIPPGHEEELRSAGRSAVIALMDGAAKFPERK
jgi:AcrR family transcriptional regulator